MKTVINVWKASMEELRNVRALSCCGIMAALSVALKFVASIDIGEFIRIGFSDLPGVVVSVLFGPAVGGIFWGMMDVLKYLVAPTGPFFPGFTISAVINGILFGFVCYRKSVSLPRVFGAQFLSKAVVGLLLQSYWLSILYHSPYWVVLSTRCLTQLVMLPVDTALCYMVLRFVERIWRRTMSMSDVV